MIKPSVDALLRGVVNSFEESVLPDLPGGHARRQFKAGLVLLRRIATIWDEVVPTLVADNRDIEETLATLAGALESLSAAPKTLRAMVATGTSGRTSGEADLRCEALNARNEILQQLLIEVQEAIAAAPLGAPRREIEAALHALYQRSLARERALSGRAG